MNVLGLFSGIGGFELGLQRAGFNIVGMCEIDPYCRKVLARHWPNVRIYHDVRELTSERLQADGISPDIICGGFPCQDISEAGHGAGIDGDKSGLWMEFARLVCQIRPRFVVVENTAALTARGLNRVLGDMASLGYDSWWNCLRACDLGAPHIRDRIWIVAHPQGVPAGRQATANCNREFAKARTNATTQVGRRTGDYGGQDWNPEPGICRVDDGISANVDRISALGNAVVPQIPEMIGRAILAAEAA